MTLGTGGRRRFSELLGTFLLVLTKAGGPVVNAGEPRAGVARRKSWLRA